MASDTPPPDDPAGDDPVTVTVHGIRECNCHLAGRGLFGVLSVDLDIDFGNAETALDLLAGAALVMGLDPDGYKKLGDYFVSLIDATAIAAREGGA
jgi:hypothetical protein